jgi:RNA polymerase sigma-70 factor, ECF subfamily
MYSLGSRAVRAEVSSGPITGWLQQWQAGDREVLARLVPAVYQELRRLARSQLRRESPGHSLSSASLVHEVYLRLLHQRRLAAGDRSGFLGIAAQTMRRILTDHARGRQRLKRGGGEGPALLEADDHPALLSGREVEEVLALDLALARLGEQDERAVRVIECRIYAGLTLEETAETLDLSKRSVQRTWDAALAWLRKELAGLPADE